MRIYLYVLYSLSLLVLLSSCRVKQHTTDRSITSTDVMHTSITTEQIISHLRDSSNVSMDIDSVNIVVITDSVGNNQSVLIKATGVKLNGSRTINNTIADSIHQEDTTSVCIEENKDIITDIDKTVIAEPPNLTLVLIICIIAIALLYFLYRKLS